MVITARLPSRACSLFPATWMLLLQVLLAVYFLLAGMIVQRQPILWVMPITSTLFAALHSIACLLGSWTSKRYNSLSPLQRACCCSLLCQLAFSAAASAAAVLLLLSHPLELLPRSLPLPAAAVQLLTSAGPAVVTPVKLIANSILGGSAIGSLIADANVQQLATPLTCAAAGYYAFRLWLLVRSRAAHQAGQLLALLQYTLLLLVYSVASYKGSQVGGLAYCSSRLGIVCLVWQMMNVLCAGMCTVLSWAMAVPKCCRRGSVDQAVLSQSLLYCNVAY